MTDIVRFPNAMRASWANNGVSQGMGPATFLDGAQWKAWNGRLMVAIMGGQRTVVLQLDAAGAAIGNTAADLPSTRIRALVQGVDGHLYAATDSGEIWRVVPS